MKLYKLLESVEIQSDVHFVYYDYDKCERYEISKEDVSGKEIRYLYVDDGELYIEVEEMDI